MAAIRKARAVMIEVNPNVPFAFGDCHMHISQVTALVESSEPLLEVGLPTIGPVQRGHRQVRGRHDRDGSTLQIGYGSIPDAVVMQLTHKHDLGIHTEMIGDGILTLLESRRGHQPAQELPARARWSPPSAWAPRGCTRACTATRCWRCTRSTSPTIPYIAGQNDNLIAINATLEIDFLGQCGSESLGPRPTRAPAGRPTSCARPTAPRAGKAFIVLPSTAKDNTISRIVPTLTPGTHVSTSKNDINYVVTEYGVAQLRGKSAKQRTQALIGIAHPDFRAPAHRSRQEDEPAVRPPRAAPRTQRTSQRPRASRGFFALFDRPAWVRSGIFEFQLVAGALVQAQHLAPDKASPS